MGIYDFVLLKEGDSNRYVMEAEHYFQEGNDLQYKQRNYTAASESYLKAIQLRPDYIEALNNHAQNLRLNIKNYQEAIIYYTKVIELNPKLEDAFYRRGLCKGLLGDLIGQIDDYSKVIELAPTSDNFVSRALIKKKAKDYTGVVEDCSQAISLNDNSSYAYQFRGEAKAELYDFKEAIADLEKAIEIEESKAKRDPAYKPMLFGALKSCAEAKFAVNDFQGSLDGATKLISLFPSHPLSYALSARAKEKLGDTDGYSKDMSDFKHLNEQHVKKYGVSFEK
ncbi:tetratricopeptide repeat protein [Pontibacter arcticus]|uniref:Uncharacterized protein n=1 Tax=Pontibacter arcticus TaxID=2080288 RepID=A0A364RAM3_9BACT|nr:hypothetical protein [Pontibacter arcticus]RAU81339.1 hypothetical protein DP923_16020 [Pontibacter arcticus]RAU81404.1 hypothetical protein DP923_16365 [Pontibacter arcticus]